jgi:hypothetical protein
MSIAIVPNGIHLSVVSAALAVAADEKTMTATRHDTDTPNLALFIARLPLSPILHPPRPAKPGWTAGNHDGSISQSRQDVARTGSVKTGAAHRQIQHVPNRPGA